jgi:hypothetical protein
MVECWNVGIMEYWKLGARLSQIPLAVWCGTERRGDPPPLYPLPPGEGKPSDRKDLEGRDEISTIV